MYRLSFAAIMLLAASLMLTTSCKAKDTDETAIEEAVEQADADEASDAAEDGAAEDDAADGEEPEVRLNAPENGLLGDQGIKNPQDTDNSADEGGLKLQLGGGSGYGYQRTQPSLLDN